MYDAYFGFSSRPFSATPCADQYFPAAVIEAARQSLERTLRQATGVGLVVGASGVGKSMLAAVLAEQLSDSFAVVLLSCGRLGTRGALLQAILHGLGQPYREMDEGELRLALIDYLRDDEPRGLALLVDEANAMPMRLLEELRLLTNLAVQGRPLVRLALLGSAALEERLATARMESFNQRLVARCYLEPLNQTETDAYILARINAAGSGDSLQSVISPEGRKAVFEATDGIPRLVNQICDHALLWACCQGRPQVDRGIVEEAWADLQQLPTPWNDELNDGHPRGDSPAVIEFGGLDDDEEEMVESPCDSDLLAEGDPLPSLRLAPGADEPPVDSVERLDRLEDTAEDLDEEFRPAGSIRPEVELVFDDPAALLNEPFEEEELIVDRYGRENRPATQAAGLESARAQSQPPAPRDETECPTPVSPTGMTNVETAAGFLQEAVSVEVALLGGSWEEEELPVELPTQVEPFVEQHSPPEEAPAPEPADAEPQTVPLRAIRAVEIGPANDSAEELLVIEDVPTATVDDPTSPVNAVRHQEFDQFFARLRRTS